MKLKEFIKTYNYVGTNSIKVFYNGWPVVTIIKETFDTNVIDLLFTNVEVESFRLENDVCYVYLKESNPLELL